MLSYALKLEFDSSDDEKRIVELLKSGRDAFNFASKTHFGTRDNGRFVNSIKTLHKNVYFPYLSQRPDTPSQVIIASERACLAAYKSVKSNGHAIDKPLVKKRLSLKLDKRLYMLKGNDIRITAVEGKRIRCHFKPYDRFDTLRGLYPMSDPTIYVKNSRVWIAFAFKIPDVPTTGDVAIGVDLGKRRMACVSDGRIITAKPFNAAKRKIRYLKRSLQSKGTKSAKRHLKKVRRKEANITRHYTHLCTNEVLKTDASIIVLEDLSSLKRPKKLAKTKKGRFKNRNSISQVPFSLLKTTLMYKARILGKEVETVNPYMTSQDDYRNKPAGVRKGVRYYASDGLVFDADVQAAINIVRKSKHPTSFTLPTDGSFKLCGQAPVNEPIVLRRCVAKRVQANKLRQQCC